ncbi:MAG TPA: VPDSG-CTERM sorting domain-containing protein [Vicinamibacterales bacterium]|mgnify:CR=1 FL=1|nr:VPDSG-CTERM sorting domain-containing protein [Acidobacteriota bacterium]HOC17903.1 VPDSG-CTERM sorting domain-containing protein [Vicinamibacterales bacterium]
MAGDFQILVTNGDGLTGLPDSFYAFCVDLQHWADTSAGATLGSMAGWDLLDGVTDYQRLGASYLANQYFSLYPDGSASNLTAAYYQVAIWELLHERNPLKVTPFNVWSVTGGSTYFSSGTLTAGAQDLIRGIDTSSPLFTYAGHLITPDHDGYGQNFIAPVPTPVPDGGTTLMLLGGALIGLDLLRRRLRP